MEVAYLLLGSNVGNRFDKILQAINLIEERMGKIITKSGIYETDSWGVRDLPPHLNCAIAIETNLPPLHLLEQIKYTEKDLGREESPRWGLRCIDIDIIYYGNEIVDYAQLKIPHPLLHERKFVLTPIVEIAPELVHPAWHKTNQELLKLCQDDLKVVLYNLNPVIA